MKSFESFKTSELYELRAIRGGEKVGEGTDTCSKEIETVWDCPSMNEPDCSEGDWNDEGTCDSVAPVPATGG